VPTWGPAAEHTGSSASMGLRPLRWYAPRTTTTGSSQRYTSLPGAGAVRRQFNKLTCIERTSDETCCSISQTSRRSRAPEDRAAMCRR
jgi:hypothetical protein